MGKAPRSVGEAHANGGGDPVASSLQDHLEGWAGSDPERVDVAATVAAIAAAAARLAGLIARGPLAGDDHGAVVGSNADGDAQRALDVRADAMFADALAATPVAALASEEREEPVRLARGGRVAVAIDPLDGSSNIDTNLSVGTIFSVLPVPPGGDGGSPAAAFARPGAAQLAAGFVVYGPHTALVLTLREGAHAFTLDREAGAFVLTRPGARIPQGRREYAINASNYRHWDEPVRAYVDDCVAGADGPRGTDFNMRWNASLVAEAYRILVRGGIFLYPRDARPGYEQGRLRLVYEANPLALVVEEAGGAATDGLRRILDLEPAALHQRVPLVLGSADKVERVARYHDGSLAATGDRSPLFGRRGLFRA
jgi:fructose-1,6-bisphosphatase I